MAKILIVDDEAGVRESYSQYLELQGYETLVAGDYNQAIAKLEECNFDLDVIVTDQVMPGRSGLDLVKAVKERTNRIQLIVMTGEPTIDTATESVRLGIFDYLLKPIKLDRLVSVVLAAVRLKQLEDKAIELENLANERTLALAESEKRYKTLVDTTGDGMAIIKDGVVVFASNRLCEILDVPLEDIIGTHFSRFFHQDELLRISELYERYTGGEGDLGIIEARMILPNGSIVFVEINGARYNYQGEDSVLFSLRDVTDRKEAEEELFKERDFKSSLIETVQIIVLVLDNDGCIVHFNPYMQKISGYRLEEVRGKDWFSTFMSKRELSRINKLFKLALGGTQTRGNINSIITKNGEERVIEWYDTTLKDTADNVVGLLAVGQDVTERKLAEEELKAAEKRFRDIAESISDWIWEIDAEGRYTYCTGNTESILGYSPDEIIGKTPFDLMPPEEAEKIGREFARIFAEKKPIEMLENWNLSKDGKLVCLLTTGVPILNDEGKLLGYRGVDSDITMQKQAEADRLAYLNDLRSLSSRLTVAEGNERRRIASLLHDGIGQDLATIGMKLKLLKETIKGGEAWSEMEAILDIVEKTTEDSRSLTFDLSPPILFQKKLGEALHWLFERECQKMGIRGTFHDGTEDVEVDQALRILLFHVYRELLFNVGKHSGADELQGSIESGNESLHISLADNGKGFIYTDARTQDSKATGYGLFIIEERIHHLKGKMSVDSKPSGGTRIEISVPLIAE